MILVTHLFQVFSLTSNVMSLYLQQVQQHKSIAELNKYLHLKCTYHNQLPKIAVENRTFPVLACHETS